MSLPELRAALGASARRFLKRDSAIAVALSGGIDSIVLLDALCALRKELAVTIAAIHVNHGLSQRATSWELFCEEECTTRGIAFEAVRLCISPGPGESLEARARVERYQAFSAIALRRGWGTVALGHHQDDQAETVLLQLLRGASPRGLSAMPEWRQDAAGIDYWRPLLPLPRQSILDYASASRIRWVDDESNADHRFKRNHLRHRVMPAIEEGFEGYRTGLARAALRAAEAAQLLDDLADLDTRGCSSDDGLALAPLRELGALRAQNVVRRMLAARRMSVPEAERLAEFVRQALEAGKSRNPSLELVSGDRLCSARGRIMILPGIAGLATHLRWQCESEVALSHGVLRFARSMGSGIAAARIPDAGFVIRSREGGERCRVAANRPSRTLKNLFQEAGIPAPLRGDWPLLVDDSSIVAGPGVAVGVDWQCPPDEPGWSVAWHPAFAADAIAEGKPKASTPRPATACNRAPDRGEARTTTKL